MVEEFLFFLEVLVGGLLTGIMYSLVALGLVLIFKASQIFNFAQGAFVLFAALTFVIMLEVGPGFWSWTGWLAVPPPKWTRLSPCSRTPAESYWICAAIPGDIWTSPSP